MKQKVDDYFIKQNESDKMFTGNQNKTKNTHNGDECHEMKVIYTFYVPDLGISSQALENSTVLLVDDAEIAPSSRQWKILDEKRIKGSKPVLQSGLWMPLCNHTWI